MIIDKLLIYFDLECVPCQNVTGQFIQRKNRLYLDVFFTQAEDMLEVIKV
jgi:hypothetical protein